MRLAPEQRTQIRDQLVAGMTPDAIGDYFGRLADLDLGDIVQIQTVAAEMSQQITQEGPGMETARYRNALIELAAGDAWGYQVEFTSYEDMPNYPVQRPAGTWIISDDTQMTLAVHDALTDAKENLGDIEAVEKALTARFIDCANDPDNNRAPGVTCMKSIRNLGWGARWFESNGARKSAG